MTTGAEAVRDAIATTAHYSKHQRRGWLSAHEVARWAHVPRRQARRYLAKLVAAGDVIERGTDWRQVGPGVTDDGIRYRWGTSERYR